jgi:glycosyltransferase involved in cell wall biosynthesis
MKHLKKALYWAAFERRVLRDARAVLFTNDEEMRLARQSFAAYRCREHAVGFGTSRPGVDPAEARRAFLSAYPALDGKRVLLFLGRIDAKKGCDLLIDAFAAIAQCDSRLHLVMAGPAGDALGSGLRALVRRRGVGDRVTWTGMLSGIMKWGAFHAAEVFALPSHQENFGVAVAEALACGVPVAISNKVNLWRDIVEDDVGWVADDTRAATQAALQRWLATDPSVLPAMRERARRTFAARYDLLIQAPRLLCALERELAGARQMRTDPASAGATLTAR